MASHSVTKERARASSLSQGCDLRAAPASLPGVLLAVCPKLTTLIVQPHLDSSEMRLRLMQMKDIDNRDYWWEDLEPEEDEMLMEEQEAQACYVRNALRDAVCSNLHVLGRFVKKIEFLAETGVLSDCVEAQGMPFLPYVQSIKIRQACLLDLAFLLPETLDSCLPALKAVEVGRLFEVREESASVPFFFCCFDSPDTQEAVQDYNALQHFDIRTRVQLSIREFSVLHDWCNNCFPRIPDLLEPLGRAHLLESVQKLQLLDCDWWFSGFGTIMGAFVSLLPSLSELCFCSLHSLSEGFADFLALHFLSFEKLSRLVVAVNAPELSVFTGGSFAEGKRTRLELDSISLERLSQAGCALLSVFADPGSALFGRPFSISLQLLKPWNCTGVSQWSVLSLREVLDGWRAQELALFGDCGRLQLSWTSESWNRDPRRCLIRQTS